jgi:ABC-type maltose transport system permease subunit
VLRLLTITDMLLLLIISEMVAFGTLYFLREVEGAVLIRKYLRQCTRQVVAESSWLARLVGKPLAFFTVLGALGVVREVGYAASTLRHLGRPNFVLFYVVLAPQIVCSMMVE